MFNLNEKLKQFAEMKAELTPALEALKTLEAEIKSHVKETGETLDSEYGKITIRKGGIRISWNGKALEGYAAAHPEILQFQKTTDVSPSVVIKLK